MGWVGMLLDVDDARRAEATIREAARLESVATLAGGVAHDFNNLLTVVQANVGLVQLKLGADHPTHRSLERAMAATRRAADLTRQLLAYGGRFQPSESTFDLNTQVVEIIALLRSSAPTTARIDVSLSPEAVGTRGDAARVRQVVMNLALNAVESLGGRPGRVQIRTRVQDFDPAGLQTLGTTLPAGTYAVLEVEDDGRGMDAATRRRIFDPYFTTKPTGHGLGLAATLGIVRSHVARR